MAQDGRVRELGNHGVRELSACLKTLLVAQGAKIRLDRIKWQKYQVTGMVVGLT